MLLVLTDQTDGSGRILESDLDYYSVKNAPLAIIRRFETTRQFLAHVSSNLGKRKMVATCLGPGSINAYSRRAKAALTSQDGILLLLGSEGDGKSHKPLILAVPSVMHMLTL
jgi:hypothetical protein